MVGGVVMFRVHVGCVKVVMVLCANAPYSSIDTLIHVHSATSNIPLRPPSSYQHKNMFATKGVHSDSRHHTSLPSI
jgi:hypothetical protein